MTLTHLNQQGQASMVDVSGKSVTTREATAVGKISMNPKTLQLITDNALKKGDVLAVARIAGIQAAKQCANLIPLCHPLALSKVSVEFNINQSKNCVDIQAYCKLAGQTGVEMEALTAVSVAALTIYDMCKAADMSMTISGICLQQKSGGKKGQYIRKTHQEEPI